MKAPIKEQTARSEFCCHIVLLYVLGSRVETDSKESEHREAHGEATESSHVGSSDHVSQSVDESGNEIDAPNYESGKWLLKSCDEEENENEGKRLQEVEMYSLGIVELEPVLV